MSENQPKDPVSDPWASDERWHNKELIDLDRQFGEPDGEFDTAVYAFYTMLAKQDTAMKALYASCSFAEIDDLLTEVIGRNDALIFRFNELVQHTFVEFSEDHERLRSITGLFIVYDAFMEPRMSQIMCEDDDGVLLSYDGILEFTSEQYAKRGSDDAPFVKRMSDMFKGISESQMQDLLDVYSPGHSRDDSDEDDTDKTD